MIYSEQFIQKLNRYLLMLAQKANYTRKNPQCPLSPECGIITAEVKIIMERRPFFINLISAVRESTKPLSSCSSYISICIRCAAQLSAFSFSFRTIEREALWKEKKRIEKWNRGVWLNEMTMWTSPVCAWEENVFAPLQIREYRLHSKFYEHWLICTTDLSSHRSTCRCHD